MGLIDRVFKGAIERRAKELKYGTLDLFREIYGSRVSASGQAVNFDSALGVATVLACCKVIAEGVAQVPWRIYQDVSGEKTPATEHYLYNLIYRRPNTWQTSFAFRETMVFHTLLLGNFYAWTPRVGIKREIRAIIPLEPQKVSPMLKADGVTIVYRVRNDKLEYVDFPADQIWHVRGPTWNGWLGMEGIGLARDAIGLSMATEKSHASFHQNGAKVTGLYAVDDKLSPEQYGQLYGWLKGYTLGGDRAGSPMVLDRGAKFTSTQMTGVDAQHIETRKHQIEEICRAFRVMPIMVGHADKTATYASAEQMFLAHVVHTLMPWFVRLEQSGDNTLLTEEEVKNGYYTKFTANALMRGEAANRADFYSKALGSGGSPAWMTANEVRDLEEMGPIDGGDELHKPVNVAPGQGSDGKKNPPAN